MASEAIEQANTQRRYISLPMETIVICVLVSFGVSHASRICPPPYPTCVFLTTTNNTPTIICLPSSTYYVDLLPTTRFLNVAYSDFLFRVDHVAAKQTSISQRK